MPKKSRWKHAVLLAGWVQLAADAQGIDAADRRPGIELKLAETLASRVRPAIENEPARPAPASRKRRKTELSLTSQLSAWSGTRRLDGAEAVAVPRLSAELSAPLASGFQFTAHADAAREQADEAAASRTKLTLREAWLGYREGPASVRLGWQVVNWGRTDVVNPTDNVAARDYTRLVDLDADQKLGAAMLNLNWRLGDSSLQAIWQPLFRATTVPLPAVAGVRYVEDAPDWVPGSGGLRLDTVGERLSWSLSYFRGPAKRPNLAISLADLGLGRIRLDHRNVSIVGADAELIAGPWVFRSETAYSAFKGSGSDPFASRESTIESVLGVERAYGEASAFVQGSLRRVFDWIDPRALAEPLRTLAIGNASVNEELYRTQFTIGGGAALNTADLRWSASFDAGWLPAHGDVVVRPRIRYRWSDRLTLWGGADYFAGPERGLYGRLADNTAVFLGLSSTTSLRR